MPQAAQHSLSSLQELRMVWRHTKNHHWSFPVLAFLGLAASVAETLGISLIILFLYALIGDPENANASGGLLAALFGFTESVSGGSRTALALIIFGLIAVKMALSLTYALFTSRIKNEISEGTRNTVFERYLKAPYGYVRQRDQGALLNLLAAESWSIADAFYCITRLAINTSAILVFSVFLALIAFPIFLFAVIGAIAVFGSLRWLSRPARRIGDDAVKALRKLSSHMINALQSMRAVRAYGAEDYVHGLFKNSSAHVRNTLLKLDRLHSVIKPLNEIGYFILLGLIAVLAEGFGIATAATLSAVALLYRLQPHVREFEGNRIQLASMGPSLAVVADIISIQPDEQITHGQTRSSIRLKKEIRFKNVSFTYPGASEPSLIDASFVIPEGCQTALSGPSGAGKTTIVNLLLGLYAPTRGEILIDGQPLKALNRADWLAGISIAGQDMELFEASIRDNIALSKPDAGDLEIAKAARAAGIHDTIVRLPHGYDTKIGERGTNLSGGQRQRIALARAILKKPSLLILDEATNAIDVALEEKVRRSVLETMPGGTVIHITHRPGDSLGLDHVIEIKDGRVVHAGEPPTRNGNITARRKVRAV